MIYHNHYDDGAALAAALADAVAAGIAAGISERGAAAVAVSGGTTPKRFFEALSGREDVDWPKVTVTLVDERWVDEDSARSNARLVRDHLLQNAAASANFVPLYTGGDVPDAARIAETCRLQRSVPHPFDAVVLGMGGDGHTASFFPGGDTLDAALSSGEPALAIRAPGAGEARATLTLPYLLNTRGLYLHIEGAAKREALEKALGDGPVAEMPIRAVLRQQEKPVNIYWCP